MPQPVAKVLAQNEAETDKKKDSLTKKNRDMKNLSELTKIAHEKRDVQALLYMHHILHDIDYWGFLKDGDKPKGIDFWGVSETAPQNDKDNRADIAKYLAKN
ncbi:hypothetical protein [Paenibacillus sp. V4I5]|uniref:hypothetical protein n=1 Tax=Paenibacillus sp. V4I5 TaxID=3042306 RepID=UPI0027D78D04|nr:hypothetical protein [Paenibacillus sp. V4I5]